MVRRAGGVARMEIWIEAPQADQFSGQLAAGSQELHANGSVHQHVVLSDGKAWTHRYNKNL